MTDQVLNKNKSLGLLQKTIKVVLVFVFGGSIIHLFVMLIDYYLMPAKLHLSLTSDFLGSLLAFQMLPMAVTYGVFVLGIYFYWQKAKVALALAYRTDAQRKEAEKIVHAMQRITGILASHLSAHNAEILGWLKRRKLKTGSVPVRVDHSSRKIAETLKILSEISYVLPYIDKPIQTIDDVETALLHRLSLKSSQSTDQSNTYLKAEQK